MNIFISGSSTLLGSAFIESFFKEGHTLYTCDDLPASNVDYHTYIKKLTQDIPIDIVMLLQANDILHTCLHSLQLRKKYQQQLQFNKTILKYFSEKKARPTTILSASSLLIYDFDKETPVVEKSPLSSSFPASFYQEIESLSAEAETAGIRVVQLRLGEILSRCSAPTWATLPIFNILPVFLGDYKRTVSWVSQEDAVRALQHILKNDEISGPVNITSGDTVRRSELTKTVCNFHNLIRTPPLPGFANHLIFGNENSALSQSNSRAVPLKLMEAGFFFEDIALQEYLER